MKFDITMVVPLIIYRTVLYLLLYNNVLLVLNTAVNISRMLQNCHGSSTDYTYNFRQSRIAEDNKIKKSVNAPLPYLLPCAVVCVYRRKYKCIYLDFTHLRVTTFVVDVCKTKKNCGKVTVLRVTSYLNLLSVLSYSNSESSALVN